MEDEKKNTQIAQTVSMLEARKRELDEARAKVTEAESIVRAKKQTFDNLRSVFDSRESYVNRLVYRRDYLNQELRNIRKEISSLEKELEAKKSELNELTEDTKEVRLAVIRARRNMKQAQSDSDAAADELDQAYAQLEIAKTNLVSAEEAFVKAGGILPSKDKLSAVRSSLSKSPWVSGSFYLFAAVVIIVLLAVIGANVPWYVLPIVIGGGFLVIIIIGAFQLRNDENLSQENFLVLMKETIRGMTILTEKPRYPENRDSGELANVKTKTENTITKSE